VCRSATGYDDEFPNGARDEFHFAAAAQNSQKLTKPIPAVPADQGNGTRPKYGMPLPLFES